MKRVRYLQLPVIVLLLLSSSLHAQIKVACIGNSITHGYQLSLAESYPVKLQTLMGNKYIVRNFGVSGRTVLKAGNYPYWNEPVYSSVLQWQPDIVIIKLGTNDAKDRNWRYKANFYKDYTDFVLSFKSIGRKPKIYICYPIPVFKDGQFTIRSKTIVNDIIPTITQIARETGSTIIDLYTPFRNKRHLTYDGVHPTAAGTTLIAKEVYRSIRQSR